MDGAEPCADAARAAGAVGGRAGCAEARACACVEHPAVQILVEVAATRARAPRAGEEKGSSGARSAEGEPGLRTQWHATDRQAGADSCAVQMRGNALCADGRARAAGSPLLPPAHRPADCRERRQAPCRTARVRGAACARPREHCARARTPVPKPHQVSKVCSLWPRANAGKGIRQNRSATSGEGLALASRTVACTGNPTV